MAAESTKNNFGPLIKACPSHKYATISLTLKYPSLNGLRAISILLVINSHLKLQHNYFNAHYGLKWLTFDFISNGNLGVNIFFVISGFLITSILLNEENQNGKISIRNFFIRRTLRIFPAYYFLLLVYVVFQYSNLIHIDLAAWLTAITYTKYFNWELDWYTGHGWSLSIEEHFYLMWPFIFTLKDKTRKVITIAIILVVPLIRIIDSIHDFQVVNDLSLFTRIDAIATGCLLAFYSDSILNKLHSYLRPLFFMSLLILFSMPYIYSIADKLGVASVFIALGTTYGTTANILIAIIVLYSIHGPRQLWFKILNTSILNTIGVLSYSIYLWQQFFLKNTHEWYNSTPLNLLLMLAVAVVSYYLIEKPFIQLKNRFSSYPNN